MPVSSTSALQSVLGERLRQINAEGFDSSHDRLHTPTDMLAAGACYLNLAWFQMKKKPEEDAPVPEAPSGWPWDLTWWKPADADRNLVKGTALAVAALDRLRADDAQTYWSFQAGDDVAKPDPPKVETWDDRVKAWADRNGFEGSLEAARLAVSDARSLERSPINHPLA